VRQEWLQTFDRKSDAEAFEAKVKLLERSDELGDLDAGKEPLEEFVAEWWLLYAKRHLKPKTRKQYRDLRDRFVLPRLGKLPLRKPTPRIIETWAAELAADGVPDATLRKMLGMLQGVLRARHHVGSREEQSGEGGQEARDGMETPDPGALTG
jgi:hypothetical protein